MPKVRSAPILFNQKVSYDLPEKINGLEIGCESRFDCVSSKRRINADVNIPTKGKVPNYNSENSDSLGSSPESSSDPDSSPTVEPPELSNVVFWKKFSTAENDPEKNCKNVDEDAYFLEEQLNLHGVIKNSGDDVADLFGDICLKDKNDEKICSTSLSDINSLLNSVNLSGTSVPSAEMKQKNSGKFSVAVSVSEGVAFSNIFGDICLKDEKDEGICSSLPPFISDIDSFLNSVNLIESAESVNFNPETKLKHMKNSDELINCEGNISLAALAVQHLQSNASLSNELTTVKTENIKYSCDMVNCNENISLADLAEQHLQLNTTSTGQHATLRSKNNAESASINASWFSPVQYKDLYSTKNKNCEEKGMLDLFVDLYQKNPIEGNAKIESEELTSQVVEDDENEDHFGSSDIDLTSCLKSLRPATPSNDSAVLESDDGSFISDPTNVSPFRFSCPLLREKFDDSPPNVNNINTKQSLFAKALSCKPKKDFSAMVKVVKLQSEVCSLFFSPPQVSHKTKPKKENAIESSQSVIGSIGRRIFGQIPQCEVS